MPKYLICGNYTLDGLKGLLKEGGSARRAALEKAAVSLGGKLEAVYFAFGDFDIYVIADMPDNASMTALSLAAGAAGTASVKTVVLLTQEEVDAAVKKHPSYRAPGQ